MKRSIIFLGLFLIIGSTVWAHLPKLINFQGKLTDLSGTPVADGVYTVKFTMYDDSTAGTVLWTETVPVQVTGGLFTVRLGDATALPDSVFSSGANRFVGVKVNLDPELAPRTRLISVPYAFHALRADTANFIAGGGGGSFLPLTGGTMTGAITNTGDPPITMGKGNFGSGNTNTGPNAFVAGESNSASGDNATVGGGLLNAATGFNATVSGGRLDTASSSFATVGGGVRNIASGNQTTIAGGGNNSASGSNATVGGGQFNISSGPGTTVGGGFSNTARNGPSTVAGGSSNIADDIAVVGGGENNRAIGYGTTVSGGSGDSAISFLATVGGGASNTAAGEWSTIPGGLGNRAGGDYSFAAGHRAKAIHSGAFVWADDGGGFPGVDFVSTAANQFLIRAAGGVGIGTNSPTTALQVAGTIYSTFGGYKFPDGTTQTTAATGGGSFLPLAGGTMTGPITNTGDPAITMGKGNFGTGNSNPGLNAFVTGQNNKARGANSVVAGGGGAGAADSNSALGDLSAIGGGSHNVVSAALGTISGGFGNTVSGGSGTIGGGLGNTASGFWATVPGGENNTALGNNSFAAGFGAKANHVGAFVWADALGGDFLSTADNQFSVRAAGGTRIYSNSALTAGVTLAAGASAWAMVSDSNLKRNIRVVDGNEMLDKVMQLPIKRWSYKAQDPSIEHIGPMSQDFYPLFKVGDDEKTISTIDPPGIALAAIQGLYKINLEQQAEIDGLKLLIEKLESRMSKMEKGSQQAKSDE